MEGEARHAALQPPRSRRSTAAKPVPERWVPERILRGHLAGAGIAAELARCGDGVVLTGPHLGGAPLVCRLDRQGPCGTLLDEPLAQAACGLMAVHGWGRGRRAARLGVDYVTTATGVSLAQGVLAALLARFRGCPTRGITVSMPATAVLTVSPYLAAGTANEPDVPPQRLKSGHPPPFRSADGVSFELETFYAEPWRAFWTGLGVSDSVAGRAWRSFTQRYATAVAPLPAALHAATEARCYADLTCDAAAAGVAVQRLRRHGERRVELASSKPFAAPWTLEPLPARHGDISGSRGPCSARYGSMSGEGRAGIGPLTGIVVVEAGRGVQVPLAGHLLGQLGAEVIRIEPTGGDLLRATPPMTGGCSARFLALNRGKRVIEADLWNPAGRRHILDAAAQADVFVHNWDSGKAAQLGLDNDRLAAVNPRLVCAHASGRSDAQGAHLPTATDSMVQAYTALPDHLTPGHEAPAGSMMPLLDILAGLITASGVLAGLLGRERDGRGRWLHSSLLSAATLLQAHLGGYRGPNGRPEFGPLGVPLAASNGHLVLSRTAPIRAVTAALRVDNLTEIPDVIAAQPVDRSVALLTAAGIDTVRACRHPAELARDLWAARLLHHDRCAYVRPPWTFTT